MSDLDDESRSVIVIYTSPEYSYNDQCMNGDDLRESSEFYEIINTMRQKYSRFNIHDPTMVEDLLSMYTKTDVKLTCIKMVRTIDKKRYFNLFYYKYK